MTAVAIFIGGGLGCLGRWGLARVLASGTGFPWGTFVANIVGCFLLGFLLVYLQTLSSARWLKEALVVGLCGGLTTFSTFVWEVQGFASKGELKILFLYLVASVMVGISAFAVATWLANTIVSAQ